MIDKGRSPFYPGQPVPIDFFIGRLHEIEKINRAITQVELGKPQSLFLTGEYGIGKSSLANFMKSHAERNNNLFGLHVFLGGAKTLEDVAVRTVEAVIKTQLYRPTIKEKIGNFLAKYIKQAELFGININFETLKADSLSISHGYLPFLRELFNRLKEDGVKGLMLILDEINGITGNESFSHFIKSLVDENALSVAPLPLMLMLCGVEERRKDMIQHHQPVERIFDIVDIKPMDNSEMDDFFNKTFSSAGIDVKSEAITLLRHYSAGFPKIMHIIGDAVFWLDQDNLIDSIDATQGIILAADEIGRKFVDQQVYKALRSKDYHSILAKLAKEKFDLCFKKDEIEKGLSENEKRKFNNFLQRMKKLNVLKSGSERGEYVFNSRLVRLYIRFNSLNIK